MIKMLRIEFKKILTYRTFWILIGLYFTFLAAGILLAEFMINHMVNNINQRLPIPFPHVAIYYFPDVWQNVAFFASIRYVLIFPAIIMIILITNEFTYKTIRQNVINGMSKTEFLLSKLLIILLISLVMTVVLTAGSFFIGLFHSGFSEVNFFTKGLPFMAGFFVSLICYMVYAFFCGFMLRNTGLAIAIFTLYSLIIEPVLYFFLRAPFLFKNTIYTYLPVNTVIRLAEYPAIPMLKKMMGLELQSNVSFTACLIPVAYAVAMTGIVFWVMKKKDL
ncbi:MAG: ABC transporter permease subunit [Bacteroidetes bacterium]|nr:ABC transporter permease subunit [Bacteroidota bacterium]